MGVAILRYRFLLLAILLLDTAFIGWQASKVKLSYDFSKAIPTDNPKYVAYQEFKKQFGEDGNLLLIGLQTDNIFAQDIFNDYATLHRQLRKTEGVEDVISLPSAMNLAREEDT